MPDAGPGTGGRGTRAGRRMGQDGLDEISRVIGGLEGQVRAQNDALEELRDSSTREHAAIRRDLGREIGELKRALADHERGERPHGTSAPAGQLEKEVFRRLQALEARLDGIDRARDERDRRQRLVVAVIALGFTAVNIVIALVSLLIR